jgi:hypothetical protein
MSGIGNQIDYKDTIEDNSIGNTTKGTKARGMTNGISTRETVEGVKARS